MVEGGCKARLRRINITNGHGVTCFPIMILKECGVTTFGRSSNNDYLLDSNVLKNFISRFHCKVKANKIPNGQMEYKILDGSMNGTFVNDVRLTAEGHVFCAGDKVNFGHLNGYNIEPGTLSKQPNSEFQFIFELVTENECSTPEADKKKYVWKSPCCKSGHECSSKKRKKKQPVMMKSLLSYFQPKSEMNSPLKEIKKDVKNEQDADNQVNDDNSTLVGYIFDETSRKIRRFSPLQDENDSQPKKYIGENFLIDSGIEKESNDGEESDATLFERVFLSVDKFLHNSDSDIFASDEETDKL